MTVFGIPLDLPFIWGVIIAFAVLMYVMMDGFDLGIGVLFPFIRGAKNRDTMVRTVEPVWDGNETWLILGGGGLFGVFPLAYSLLMTAFYAPLIAMLLALVFRGVAFEFRFKDPRHKPFWDFAFAGGSLVATLCQGIVLGAFIQGIAVEDRIYGGGWFDWLTPFSVLTGISLAIGYAMLGATWLVMKTTGELQSRCYELLPKIGIAMVVALGVVSLWTPFLDEQIYSRWFTWPKMAYASPLPILTAAAIYYLYRAIKARREVQPFLLTLTIFILSYIGLGIGLFPHIVPPNISIWEAAAPPQSQAFLLVGGVVLLPIILGYTAWAYWVFRGKVRSDEGYE